MNTETLDRLYLEWSQFTSARTKRELDAIRALERLLADWPDKETEMLAWDYGSEVLKSLRPRDPL
jgi:hypothetical protein